MRNPHMGNLDTLDANPVAPGTSAFDKVVNSIQALTGAASSINNTWTGKTPPPVQIKPATDWNKILIYGGLGILGVVLVLKLSKGRRR